MYFVSACQMMLKLEFFPRVLSKIVDVYCYMKSFHFELKLLCLFSRVAIFF